MMGLGFIFDAGFSNKKFPLCLKQTQLPFAHINYPYLEFGKYFGRMLIDSHLRMVHGISRSG